MWTFFLPLIVSCNSCFIDTAEEIVSSLNKYFVDDHFRRLPDLKLPSTTAVNGRFLDLRTLQLRDEPWANYTPDGTVFNITVGLGDLTIEYDLLLLEPRTVRLHVLQNSIQLYGNLSEGQGSCRAKIIDLKLLKYNKKEMEIGTEEVTSIRDVIYEIGSRDIADKVISEIFTSQTFLTAFSEAACHSIASDIYNGTNDY